MDERIKKTDTSIAATIKLAEGNPGAMTVCVRIINEGAIIDPDNFLGGIGILLSLDTFKIYGIRIWMLYKDVCRENLPMTIAVLRGCQMGMLKHDVLNHAIDNRGDGIDVEQVYNQVKERLPAFDN